MCADVVQLRRGDHSAQRLLLERERAAAQERDADLKWKRKIIVGLETLAKYVENHPEAKAAFDEFARQVRHPFDPSENPAESESISPSQTDQSPKGGSASLKAMSDKSPEAPVSGGKRHSFGKALRTPRSTRASPLVVARYRLLRDDSCSQLVIGSPSDRRT
jgi:hypothetical protein